MSTFVPLSMEIQPAIVVGTLEDLPGGNKRYVRAVRGKLHLERLRALLETLTTLRSPGLPQGADLQQRGDELVLTYELSPGQLLSERRLKAHGADRLRILRWSGQINAALAALHRLRPHALTHGEVSADRVWIDLARQEARLLDFGKILDGWHADANAASDTAAWAKLVQSLIPQGEDIALPAPIGTAKTLGEALKPWLGKVTDPTGHDAFARLGQQLLRGLSVETPELPSVGCPRCGRRTAGRFCANCAEPLGKGSKEARAQTIDVPVRYDEKAEADLKRSLQENAWSAVHRAQIFEGLERLDADTGFQTLRAPMLLPRVTKMPHQVEAVKKVLGRMRGRAMLADEVGLGKTIEAGLILKELVVRQKAPRILVLCPRQLLGQWQEELSFLFDEPFLVFGRDVDTALGWYCPRLIAPHEVLSHRGHAEAILESRFDLLIVDEAHALFRPEAERSLRTVKALRKTYFLMLTATPLRNSVDDLYNVVTLLRPGHFGELADFRTRYQDPHNEHKLQNADELRRELDEVMIRNTRRQVSLGLPPRRARTLALTLAPDAKRFYDEFQIAYGEALAPIPNRLLRARVGDVVERLCSSREAFDAGVNAIRRDRGIARIVGKEFTERTLAGFAARYPASLTEPKEQLLLESLEPLLRAKQHVLVFSEFNETAAALYAKLAPKLAPSPAFLYDERAGLDAKLSEVRRFRESPGGVLFCPGEAAEGLNLQFCSTLFNYDLPWDPMRIEQRIGRVQRIGIDKSIKEILVFNLILSGTLEEQILKVCEDKLKMFGQVIGEPEAILGGLEGRDEIRLLISDVFLGSKVTNDEGKSVSALDHLYQVLDETRQRQEEAGSMSRQLDEPEETEEF